MRVSVVGKEAPHPALFESCSFETPLTLAACRNWIGDFFEEATANLLSGKG